MSILNVFKLSKAYNIYPIFKDVTFQINEGDKVALVGINGAGKSTLLRIIAGLESSTGGDFSITRGLKVAYLAQEVRFDSDKTIYDEMLTAFDHVTTMEQEIARLEGQMATADHDGPDFEKLLEEYGELTHRFELIGGYDYDTRIKQVLTGLNFPPDMWQHPVTRLSGGQKTRAALARTLLTAPDLLMLDEPTNHLDLKTIEWLENFLADWPGTVIIISHDRFFLDKVVMRVLDLSFGRVEDYPGNYTKYLGLRAERLERRMAEYEAQQEQIARTEEFIRRYKNGVKYRQARGRQKQLDRLERIERPKENDKLHLALQSDLRSGKLVLTTEDVAIGWRSKSGPHELFSLPDLTVRRGERVAIIGPNGSGKSTFLKTIMGEITPLRGEVNVGASVKVGYYAQSHEGLNFGNSMLEEILWAEPMSEGAARNYLGRFQFSNDDVFKKVGDLSGGERSRLAIAKLMLTKANFLILDEPTNHLDINAREALEDLLNEFDGTVLFVSHDRFFIDNIASQVWEVSPHADLKAYLGNYTDYLGWLAKAKETASLPETRPTKNGSAPVAASTNGKSNGHSSNGHNNNGPAKIVTKEDKQRNKKVSDMENAIAKLEARLAAISTEMTAASAKQDVAAITRLGAEYTTATDELEKLYYEWGALAG